MASSIKPSMVLAVFGWLFVFLTGACLLLGSLPFDGRSVFLILLFFIVAVIASAVADSKDKTKLVNNGDVRVSIAGQVYKDKSLQVIETRSGGLFISVDLAFNEMDEDEEDEPSPTKEPVKTPVNPFKYSVKSKRP